MSMWAMTSWWRNNDELKYSSWPVWTVRGFRFLRVVLKAFPLAKEVRLFLEENQKNLLSISRKEMSELEVAKLKSKLMDKFKEANFPQPAKTVDSIIALGKLILIGYRSRPIKLKIGRIFRRVQFGASKITGTIKVCLISKISFFLKNDIFRKNLWCTIENFSRQNLF